MAGKRLLPLLLFPLLLLACGKPAQEAPPVEAPKAAVPEVVPEGACRWSVTVRGEGIDVPAEVGPDAGMGVGVLVWRGELNGDGAEDLLLRFPEGCGNYGECPYALYVACEDRKEGLYREVWEPDYALDVQMGPMGEDGWRQVLRRQREGDQMHEETLTYRNGGYRAATR